jgi:pimeloyl-ACP methyl ester carboxylesterase
MLTRLGCLVDTLGARRRMAEAKSGFASQSRSDVRFHRTRRVQFRYREAGAGPTIVFSADPPATVEAYDALISALAPRWRVIVFELPAMGFSPARESFDFSFRQTADEIADFLAAVAGERAILAFSCAAGLAAIDIAARRPELAAALMLVQTTDWTGFQIWKARRDPKGVLGSPFLGQFAMKKIGPSRAPQWFDLALGERSLYAPLCACAKQTLAEGAQWSLASAYQRTLRGDVSPVARPAQPMLVIWGDADGSHDADAPQRAATLGEGAEILRWSDCGHFSDLERPERFAATLEDFVRRRDLRIS